MQARFGRLVWLVALGLLTAPTLAHAQANNYYEVPPPDPDLPIPLGWQRYNQGGFYFAGEFLFFAQHNPMSSEIVGVRGFRDMDGRITGVPGTFVGNAAMALNTDQVAGPTTYEPGFSVNLGWRLEDGQTLGLAWWHIPTARYSATASLIPTDFNVGAATQNTFLFAPVANFPIAYAGPDTRLRDLNGAPAVGTTFGIWNGASLMTEQFTQRFDKVDIGARIPIYETDCWRSYALFGGRMAWLWERYWWQTVATDISGVSTPIWTANYTNIISQRLYGVHCGLGNEWYLGSNHFGGLSVLLDLDVAGLVDIAKLRARYELGDSSTAATHNRMAYTIVPEAEASLALMWYPTQAIQVRLGWDFLAFFNTYASPVPIDFNFGSIDPRYETGIFRLFNGFRFGVSFAF
jgi:hypothetical protein